MRAPVRVAILRLETPEMSESNERVQLHLTLPHKIEARDHHKVRAYLDRGFRIVQFQRVTDREVIVTLTNAPTSAP